ncbi:MAG: choice-of-anchor D domain-containing protein [Candidatus Kapabacteria bacterium]|nr:choice-of-anchor D domain-containing protein [Candidatus Kapabacteria bacterium]
MTHCSALIRLILLGCAALFSAVPAAAQYWKSVPLPAPYDGGYFYEIFFLQQNPQYGWVVGDMGMTMRTTNGGTTWVGSLVPQTFPPTRQHLEWVQFLDTLNGYCSGPAGIFKSTDGGASWTAINPTGVLNTWGSYFLNVNYGILIGGGCATNQTFYKTTDGGASWTTTTTSTTTSGLTDLILYPDGSGFAASSGRIWQTADSGTTWTQYLVSGPTSWNEDLQKMDSTFIVPSAGNSCSGTGGGGGAWMTTDMGTSWNRLALPVPCYGTFLLSTRKAWLCGVNRNVWYTSDGGLNWESRNCGVQGDMDDLWFFNDTAGFVIGRGIYRYSPAERILSKNTVNFGVTCPPLTVVDTLWIHNRSWNISQATWSLSGSDFFHFNVLAPGTQTVSIPPCDSVRVIVQFAPRSGGVKNATLSVSFPQGSATQSVALTGEQRGSSATIADTLIQVMNAECSTPVLLNSIWLNSSGVPEQITQLVRISGDSILNGLAPPLTIPVGGTTIPFSYVPTDTGWATAQYRARITPCNRDTSFTLRVYGVSPIITAVSVQQLQSRCLQTTVDSVTIQNTGNSNLIVSDLALLGSTSVSLPAGQYPFVIAPGGFRKIAVQFTPTAGGSFTAILRITNNDKTTRRGQKSPYDITLDLRSDAPAYAISDTLLDMGELCIGSVRERQYTVRNTGIAACTLGIPTGTNTAFRVMNTTQFPVVLQPRDSVQILVRFTPTADQEYSDTLRSIMQPCNGLLAIALRGRGVTTSLTTTPKTINTFVKAGRRVTMDIVIRSTGSADAILSTLVLNPPRNDWRIINAPSPLPRLKPGDSITVTIEFTPDTASADFAGSLCAGTSGVCAASVCTDVIAAVTTSLLDIDRTALDFGIQRCAPRTLRDSVVITNTGTDNDVLESLVLNSGATGFRIISPTTIPATVPAGAKLSVVFESAQVSEGVETATAVMRFAQGFNKRDVTVTLRSEYRKTATTVSPLQLSGGTVELCDTARNYTVRFTNTGTADDALTLVRTRNEPSLGISPAQLIDVPANGTATATITFTPSAAALGAVSDEFVWQSTVCGDILRVRFDATVIRPRLVITPAAIPFGTVWRNTTRTDSIIISNPSQTARRVTAVIIADNDSVYYTTDFAPFTAEPGKTYVVRVRVTPRQVGTHPVRITVIEESSCRDTTAISATATTPDEQYSAHIYTNNYSPQVGDTVNVELKLRTDDARETALWRANPEAIDIRMTYNHLLMNIISANTQKNGVSSNLPFTSANGIFTTSISGTSVERLGATGTLCTLRVLAMQTIPGTDFIRPTANAILPVFPPQRTATITQSDSIFSTRTCPSWVSINFAPTYVLTIVKQPVNESDGAIPLRISSTGEQWITLRVVNILGETVGEHSLMCYSAGDSTEPLPASGLASGLYFILCTNNHGITQQVQCVIER